MPIPNHSIQVRDYFNANKHKYNFVTHEGCGKYTEDLVRECLRPLNANWGLLAYNGPGTKYNGHRIDSVLYRLPDDASVSLKLSSTDIIANAETTFASSGWSRDEPRYTIADWLTEPADIEHGEHDFMVPYVAYDENGFQRLKKLLSQDYSRRPQEADFDVSVWAARVFHSTYMGPVGIPLGMEAALRKHRPEWCGALGVPVDEHWN